MEMNTLEKYLLVFQFLPESALEEAVSELKKIIDFYADRDSPVQLPATPKQIVGRINSIQVRPAIVLEQRISENPDHHCAQIYTPSDRANRWLRSQANPTVTIEQLIELAANPSHSMSLRIAKALDLSHPDRVSSPLGAPVKVSDEALICLRDDGLTYAKISEQLGLSPTLARLSPTQVGNRLRKIKKQDKKNA